MKIAHVAEEKNPVVLGRLGREPDKPTILFYGHYDVQPAMERDWHTDPFELASVDCYLYGRGTSDNKVRNEGTDKGCGVQGTRFATRAVCPSRVCNSGSVEPRFLCYFGFSSLVLRLLIHIPYIQPPRWASLGGSLSLGTGPVDHSDSRSMTSAWLPCRAPSWRSSTP